MEFNHATTIKEHLFTKISHYLNENGISISYETLNANIHLTREEIKSIFNTTPKPTPKLKLKKKSTPKLKLKPKNTPSAKVDEVTTTEKPTVVTTSEKVGEVTTSEKPKVVTTSEKPTVVTNSEKVGEVTTSEKPKVVTTSEKPKVVTTSEQPKVVTTSEQPTVVTTNKKSFKLKLKVKAPTHFDTFIDICNKHNIPYFKYNDENLWSGPAVKLLESHLEVYKTYYQIVDIKHIKANQYYIIHPSQFENDSHITYPELFEQCKLIKNTLVTLNSDNEDDYNCDTDNSDNSDLNEIETTEWTFNKTKYLVDDKNNVYSYDTIDLVGVKIFSEEFKGDIIDFH